MIVDRATKWESRGWTYSALGRNKYKAGDRVVQFDLGMKTVEAIEMKGISTPDGRHFVAYRPMTRTAQRKLTEGRWKTLKELEVIGKQADARRRVIMSESKWRAALAVAR